jgi:hypothetical protein
MRPAAAIPLRDSTPRLVRRVLRVPIPLLAAIALRAATVRRAATAPPAPAAEAAFMVAGALTEVVPTGAGAEAAITNS